MCCSCFTSLPSGLFLLFSLDRLWADLLGQEVVRHVDRHVHVHGLVVYDCERMAKTWLDKCCAGKIVHWEFP